MECVGRFQTAAETKPDSTHLKQKVTRSPHGVLVTSAMQRSTLLPSAE